MKPLNPNIYWFQTEGLFHTSPGQRPGYRRVVIQAQAKGLPHPQMNRAFGAHQKSLSGFPRALPWAGMTDAVGVADDTHQPCLAAAQVDRKRLRPDKNSF
jgi:hypothetical protein